MKYILPSLLSLSIDFLIIGIGYLICTEISVWRNLFSFSVLNFMPVLAGCLMVCAFTAFCFDYFFQNSKYVSAGFNAIKFVQQLFIGIYHNDYKPIAKEYTYSFFLIIVKLVFIPLMIQFTASNFMAINNNIQGFISGESGISGNWAVAFNNSIYPLLLMLCFFIDTLFYLFGYLIYNESLGNKIRSVETTFFGWLSALLCYPPFVIITGYFFRGGGNDYPFWENAELTAVLRIVMFLLLIVYTLATVNLGWKCSNLTNRGIVTHGVYSVVRHPAYIAKNLFWWISLLPIMFTHPISLLYMLGFSTIYFFRALTEERHLYKDPEYVDYCRKVKYRFIPKVF